MDSQSVANIISAVAAVLTLAAVITAIVAIKDNRKQAQTTQHHSSRPLLVPNGDPKFQQDHANWLDWNTTEQKLTIQNVGTGVALNIASVIRESGHSRSSLCSKNATGSGALFA